MKHGNNMDIKSGKCEGENENKASILRVVVSKKNSVNKGNKVGQKSAR